MRGSEEGFTFIELMVAVSIVGVLMTIGMVMYGKAVHAADAVEAQMDLVTGVKVESLHYLEHGVFTGDADALRALEPNLEYSSDGTPAGSLVVRTEVGREGSDVCLFATSGDGSWYSMYHSALAGDLYGTSEPVECVPVKVAGWSRQAW